MLNIYNDKKYSVMLFTSILAMCILFSDIAFTQDPPDPPDAVTKVGTSAANWLKIDSGVRGMGMGGSQAASGRGLSGAYYNPASIAFIEKSEVYYSKSNYLAGITHNTLGYGTKLTPTDYFALHLFYLDDTAMLVIVAPLYVPLIIALGFDPIWYGVLYTITCQIAYMTPPFGYNLFLMRAMAPKEISLIDIYRSIIPFVIVMCIGLALVMIFPEIATWLPEYVNKR